MATARGARRRMTSRNAPAGLKFRAAKRCVDALETPLLSRGADCGFVPPMSASTSRCPLALVVALLAAAGWPSVAAARDGNPCGAPEVRRVGTGTLRTQDCPIWIPRRLASVPAWSFTTHPPTLVGRLARSGTANWFVCQRSGPVGGDGPLRNRWWALTRADNGRTGWLGQVYFQGGGPDEADGRLRHCAPGDMAWAKAQGAEDPTGKPQLLPPDQLAPPAPPPAPPVKTPAKVRPRQPGEIGRERERRDPDKPPRFKVPPKVERNCEPVRLDQSIEVRFRRRDERFFLDKTQIGLPPTLNKPGHRNQVSDLGTVSIGAATCRDARTKAWTVVSPGVSHASAGLDAAARPRGKGPAKGWGLSVIGGQGARKVGRSYAAPYIDVQSMGCNEGRTWKLARFMGPQVIGLIPHPAAKWASLAASVGAEYLPDDKVTCAKLGVHRVTLFATGGELGASVGTQEFFPNREETPASYRVIPPVNTFWVEQMSIEPEVR